MVLTPRTSPNCSTFARYEYPACVESREIGKPRNYADITSLNPHVYTNLLSTLSSQPIPLGLYTDAQRILPRTRRRATPFIWPNTLTTVRRMFYRSMTTKQLGVNLCEGLFVDAV